MSAEKENEKENNSYRDPHDNCPTEAAVLRREWRHKTATIAILTETIKQQSKEFHKLRDAVIALLDDMGASDDGMEANLMQEVRNALSAWDKSNG
jgi:hypothetical protein